METVRASSRKGRPLWQRCRLLLWTLRTPSRKRNCLPVCPDGVSKIGYSRCRLRKQTESSSFTGRCESCVVGSYTPMFVVEFWHSSYARSRSNPVSKRNRSSSRSNISSENLEDDFMAAWRISLASSSFMTIAW